jgi:hypothetical protein
MQEARAGQDFSAGCITAARSGRATVWVAYAELDVLGAACLSSRFGPEGYGREVERFGMAIQPQWPDWT